MREEQETLPELIERRKRELGRRGEPLTNRDIWRRGGIDNWSHQAVNNLANGATRTIRDPTAERLALALDVSLNEVLVAAGQRRRNTSRQLPPRANSLTDTEWKLLIGVLDGFLGAYSEDDSVHPAARTRARTPRMPLRSARALEIPEPPASVAARRGRSRGKEALRAQDADAEHADEQPDSP